MVPTFSSLQLIEQYRAESAGPEVDRRVDLVDGVGEVHPLLALLVADQPEMHVRLAVAHGIQGFRPRARAELDLDTGGLGPQVPHLHQQADRLAFGSEDREGRVVLRDRNDQRPSLSDDISGGCGP